MNVILTQSYEESAEICANIILEALKKKPDILLGLATGDSVRGIYKRLIDAGRAGDADFSRALTVNLDEYVGCAEEDSYRKFMFDNLFDHINISPDNITIAGYTADPVSEVARLRRFFELNTVDLQLLGMGPNGHIGFVEPGNILEEQVHVARLTESTKNANSRWFKDGSVPETAITIGIGDILRARSILMLVAGESKRDSLRELLNNASVTTKNPSTLLRLNSNVTVVAEKSLV